MLNSVAAKSKCTAFKDGSQLEVNHNLNVCMMIVCKMIKSTMRRQWKHWGRGGCARRGTWQHHLCQILFLCVHDVHSAHKNVGYCSDSGFGSGFDSGSDCDGRVVGIRLQLLTVLVHRCCTVVDNCGCHRCETPPKCRNRLPMDGIECSSEPLNILQMNYFN